MVGILLSSFHSSVMLMAAAEPFGSELRPAQRREILKKLVVSTVVDISFSVKDAYFSPLFEGVSIFFTASKSRVLGILLLISMISHMNPVLSAYFHLCFPPSCSCSLEVGTV